MPFKSEKQRKWMYANEPEMAKKWEKEEALKEKLRKVIRQEIKSINEGFEKYHLGGLLDSKLKKRLERAIKLWSGKVDAVGDDYIKFRMSSPDVSRFPALLKKLDHNKNVWIGDKRKNNIWDRKRNIDKLHKEAFRPKGVSLMKKIVFLPKSKLYFDPDNGNFWLMGPYGGEPDWEEDPIEPKDRDYKRTLSRLSSKDKSIMKKSLLDKGFTSIGCEPCTRAIKPGEDLRAGRWWWEQDGNKECGLHIDHKQRIDMSENNSIKAHGGILVNRVEILN